jgi:hypothetical protein
MFYINNMPNDQSAWFPRRKRVARREGVFDSLVDAFLELHFSLVALPTGCYRSDDLFLLFFNVRAA